MAVPSKNSTVLSLDAQRLHFVGGLLIALCLCWLSPSSRATTITNLTEQAFTNALNTGGMIKFAVSGVLELTSTKVITNTVTIDCSGQNVVFSGGGSNRMFTVMSSGDLTLQYAALSNGCSTGTTGANGANATSTLVGQPGTAGAVGQGGAIFNSNGIISMLGCTVISNRAIGGIGGKGGNASSTRIAGNGADGGKGKGGALYSLNGKVSINESLFVGNTVIGGDGGNGGDGFSISIGAGNGGIGAYGYGADLYIDGGIINSTNSTFYASVAKGGKGGNGGTGGPNTSPYRVGGGGGWGAGGCLYAYNYATNYYVNNTFVLGNTVGGAGGTGRTSGTTGSGYGGILNCEAGYYAVVTLKNSIVASNVFGGNAYGVIVDGGNNISSDSLCGFTATNSLNSTDPKIGTLTANGGATLTVAIASNSPCINVGNSLVTGDTDQRHYYFQGQRDIGAFEYGAAPFKVSLEATGPYASEEGETGFFTIFRTPATGVLEVPFTISGTAQNGTDYVSLTNTVVLSNGISFKRVYVKALADGLDDDGESVHVALQTSTNYLFESNSEKDVWLLEKTPQYGTSYFQRGTSSARGFRSYVASLGNQTGVALDLSNGNVTNLFPANPWTSTFYHYDATNTASPNLLTSRIPFKNPIAAFGSRVGGSEMITGKAYSFAIYAGAPEFGTTNFLSIRTLNKTNCALINEAWFSLPSVGMTNEWATFLQNDRSITLTTNGVTTTVKWLEPSTNLNIGTNASFRVTHIADNTAKDYIYEVSLLGGTYDGAMILDATTNQVAAKLYTAEFTVAQAWRTQLLDKDYFNSRVMPPIYEGKAVAQLVTNKLVITNAVSLSPSACTNLDNSPELRKHPLLDDFVASMDNDPISLANFVFNEVELSDAVNNGDGNTTGSVITDGGVERGALAVFQERRGSPTEQCALLVYLLRQAGVPAAYMYATNTGMGMSEDRVSRMLRLQLNGINFAKGKSDSPQNYAVKYPWVAAYIGTNWVHIFPWIKDTEIVEGFDVFDYLPEGYNSGFKWSRKYILGDTNIISLSDVNTPNVLFKKYLDSALLQNAPGISIDDLGMRMRDRRKYLTRWSDFPVPDFMPSQSVAISSLSSISNALPAVTNIFNTLSIQITSKSNPTNILYTDNLRMVDVHGRQLIVWHYPTNTQHQMILTLSEFRPTATNRLNFSAANLSSLTSTSVVNVLSVTNVLEASENVLGMKITYNKQKIYKDNGTNSAVNYFDLDMFSRIGTADAVVLEKELYKGDLTAICVDFGRVSNQMMDAMAERYWLTQKRTVIDPTYAANLNPETVQGPLSYLIGSSYHANIDSFRDAAGMLFKMQSLAYGAIVAVNLTASRDESGNLPMDRYSYRGMSTDVIFQNVLYAANASARADKVSSTEDLVRDFNALFTLSASAEEHQVLNQFLDTKSANSTVTMLHLTSPYISGNTNVTRELNINNYADEGEKVYGGKKLKNCDLAIWGKITAMFADPVEGKTSYAYVSPGVVTNSLTNYSGIAALLLSRRNSSALLSSNLNDGEIQFYLHYDSPVYLKVAQIFAQQDFGGGSPADNNLVSDESPFSDYSGLNVTVGGFNFVLIKPVKRYTIVPAGVSLEAEAVTAEKFSVNLNLSPQGIGKAASAPSDGTLAYINGEAATGLAANAQYQAVRNSNGSADPSPVNNSKTAANSGNTGIKSNNKTFFQMVSDPVDVMTGAFNVDATDLIVPGALPIVVARNYASGNPMPNNVGIGWKIGMLPFIVVSDDGSQISADEMDGTVVTYTANGLNSWKPLPEKNKTWNNTVGEGKSGLLNLMNNRVAAVTNGLGVIDKYYLTSCDGSVREYNIMEFPVNSLTRRRPYLVKMTDTKGNYLSFSYGTNTLKPEYGELVKITSSSGPSVEFDFSDVGSIASVSTSDGRTVSYSYDNYGDLVRAVLPDKSRVEYEYKHIGITTITNQTFPVRYVVGDPWVVGSNPDGVYRIGTIWYFNVDQTNSVNIIDGIRYTNVVNFLQLYTWEHNPNHSAPAIYEYSTNCYYTTNVITTVVTNISNGTEISTHLIAKETKPDGRVLKNIYDADGRVIAQYSTAGKDLVPILTAGFAYSNNFNVTNWYTNQFTGYTYTTNALGAVIKYSYTNSLISRVDEPLGVSRVVDWFTESETNSAGYYPRSMESETDKRGLVKRYKYDSLGNVTNLVVTGDLLGDGSTVSFTNNYVFNTNSLPLEISDSAGKKLVFQYDTTYLYNPVKTTLYVSNSAVSTNLFAYTNVSETVTNGSLLKTNVAFGVLIQSRMAAGAPEERKTELGYDARGFLNKSIGYTFTTDPNITTYFASDYRGLMVESRNTAGHTQRFDYDAMGRPTSQEVYDQNGKAVSWAYTYYNDSGEVIWADGPKYNPEDYVWMDYDGAGRKTQEVRWRSRAKADGTGVEAEAGNNVYATSFFEYDGFGNLTRQVNSSGSYVTNSYDAIGRLTEARTYDSVTGTFVSTNRFGYEPGGQVSAQTNALGGITRFYYTSTGQLARQENADGTVLGWRYFLDGRLQKTILSNGNYWEMEYDDINRKLIKRFKQANGTLLATETREFDRQGNLLKTTDAEGYTAEMFYDGLGRVTTSMGPVTVSNVSTQQVNYFYYDGAGVATTNVNQLGETGITIRDALGRSLTNDLYTSTGTLLRRSTFAYADDHNSVTSVSGWGSTAITNKVFTDTFGRAVLSHGYTGTATNYSISTYDILGNLVASRDTLGQTTTFTYDGLSRLQAQTLPDGATTTFSYNPAGNLVSRVMPGGMTWSATFDTAGRTTAEQLAKGTNVTRSFSYSFYPSNNTYAGMLSSISDPRGITRAYSYDDYLRLAQSTSTGSLSEQNQTNSYTYDKLGRVLQIGQTTGNSSPTTVSRSYDGYGQLYDEQVAISATTISHFTQKWDAAGRRKQLAQTGAGTGGTIDYTYQADNLLASVQQGGLTFNYGYFNNGLLNQRVNPLVSRTVTGRDGMGRPTGINATVTGLTPSSESMSYRANSTLSTYLSFRSGIRSWNEGKVFTYNNRGQLTQETLSPMGTADATYTYGFDTDKLGVLISANVTGEISAGWAATSLDAFSRSKTESLSVTNFYLQAKGYAVGAGRVSLTLDGSPLSTYYDDSKTNGLWLADMQLGAGSHTLKATATHPFGTYTNSATNTFTVLAKAGTVTNVYDAVGNVTLRSMPGGRAQTLIWDAAGRLLRVQDRNGTNDGYEWTAIYDGLGRRWQTTFQTVTNNVIQTNAPLVTTSWFDPLVEFQELAVSVNGQRTWKVYGPDLNGSYGGLQGTGGLEATVRESDGLATGLVNDAFGNVLASLTADGVVWNPTKVNGYGPLPGFEPLVLSTNVTLAEATVWRSKRIDPTGLYWLGARYYDPADARFLSCDPLGLGSDPSLYAAFGGDPVNRFDPDGRLVTAALDIDDKLSDPYSHAARTGIANGLVDFGMPMVKMATGMLPGGSAVSSLTDPFFDQAHTAINDGFNQHTAGFTPEQGYIYAGTGFVGEVGLNFIPIAGMEEAAASVMSRVGALASEYTPTFLKWGQADLGALAKQGVNWLDQAAPGLNPGNYRYDPAKVGMGAWPDYVSPKKLVLDGDRFPVSAANLEEASAVGVPLPVNRGAADGNRATALQGLPKIPGFDLDEAPPAMFRNPGDPVIVRPTPPRDNRGAGSSLGNQARDVPNGGSVIIVIERKNGN